MTYARGGCGVMLSTGHGGWASESVAPVDMSRDKKESV